MSILDLIINCKIMIFLHVCLVIRIFDESRQMLRLDEHRIQIGVGKAYKKFNFFWICQAFVGLEFSPCFFFNKMQANEDIEANS